jgi:Asp-tRNA(Asn)/Glu-tRNA(Gln) amidotransferase A subunit family amidase/Asp-tRNA(Asn)/Glu-tRNA(Gln) amidotransferase C subunit
MSTPPKPTAADASLPADDSWPRREVLKALAAAGFTAGTFGRALVALAGDSPKVTTDMIEKAAWVSGIDFSKADRKLMVKDLEQTLAAYAELRKVPLDNGVPMALAFEPRPVWRSDGIVGTPPAPGPEKVTPTRPASDEDLAFASATTLSTLLIEGKVTSVELTRLYLDRLKRADPTLQCVVHLTEELALEQAEAADEKRAKDQAEGHANPLTGIPWGAKDLIAVQGAPTTWGAGPYKEQVREEQATVVDRLAMQGAVLLAKLSVGELAWGDVWYGGTTKNPWKTDQGSSGSSAGSGAATAAGLVGFALGTETWGSIISPATRCGVSGLRPTFGRVSRYGVMALAWSMDKVGVLARSVEDLGLVFPFIQGADGRDPAVRFEVRSPNTMIQDPRGLKIGYPAELFDFDYTQWAEEESEKPGLKEWQALDQETLKTLRELGFNLIPITLPKDLPIGALQIILTAEAAAAFDDLVRSGRVKELARQSADAWPNIFRQGQMIPAVEYVRANRIRTLLMRAVAEMMKDVQLFVAPTYGGDHLLMTNLTGHPAVVVPNGFRASDGTPTSITFTGQLDGEADLLAAAKVYQEATGFHLRRPPLQF